MKRWLARVSPLALVAAVLVGACSPQGCCAPHDAASHTDAGVDAEWIRPVSDLAKSYGEDLEARRCIAILGQSNAAGRKFIEQVSAPQHDILVGSFAHVPISEWESQKTSPFSVLYDTLHQTGSQTPVSPNNRALSPRPYTLVPNAIPNMGTELSLGHGLDPYAPNKWGIIKCSIGGTTLAHEWCPLCTYPTTGPPNLYSYCTQYVQDAAKSLGCTVSAIWWIQGESDALLNADASAYQANLTTLAAAFRSIWPRIPIIIHRLPSNLSVGGDNAITTIRAQQLAFVAATPRTGWVDSDGLVLDQGLHFVPDAYVTLGYRGVPVIINAMGFALPPTVAWSVQAQNRTANFTSNSSDPNMGSQINPPVGGSVQSWHWDFGDGSTATTSSASHTYATDGSYTVSLLVRNSAGVAARSTQTVTIALPTWTTDATSGVGFPSTSAEWTDFETKHSLSAFGLPANGYTFQQSSGTIADFLGSKTLTVSGAAVYQRSISGWSRKAIGGSGILASQSATNATFTNISATSWMVLGYVRFDAAPTANRSVLEGGASSVDDFQAPGGQSGMRKRTGSSTINSTLTHAGATVHPYVILWDRTNHRDCLFSDIEKICITWADNTGSTLAAIFNVTTDNGTAVSDFLGIARWEGAAAERSDAEIVHLLRALGWNPSGY